MDCEICCLEIKKNDKKFVCKKCNYKICDNCIKEYLVKYANLVPKCPNCNLGLNTDELQYYLGSNKFNKFLQNSTKITMSIEKQKIPEVLEEASVVRIKKRFYKLFIKFTKKYKMDMKLYLLYEINRKELDILFDKFIFNINDFNDIVQHRIIHNNKYENFMNEITKYCYIRNQDVKYKNFPTVLNNCLCTLSTYIPKILNKKTINVNNYNRYYKACIYLNKYLKNIRNMEIENNKNITNEDIPELQEFVKLYVENYKTIYLKIKTTFINDVCKCEINNNMSYSCVIKKQPTIKPKTETQQPQPEQPKPKEVKYIMPCSTPDCKGMINTKHKCELCNSIYCGKCFVKIDDNNNINNSNSDNNNNDKKIHICKQEDIDNYNFILSTTKACPNCAARIFRTEGCPQMFCTQCQTGFDYNTGKVITSNFHNPHRMEWLRSTGALDVQQFNGGGGNVCGRNIDDYQVRGCDNLVSIIHQKNHVRQMCVDKFRSKLEEIDGDQLYKNIRILYIINEINDKQYYLKLRHLETKKHKYKQLLSIYSTFVDTIDDYMRAIYIIYRNLKDSAYTSYNIINHSEIKKYILEIINLTKFINEELEKISKMFNNCKYYKIDSSLFDENISK